MSIKERRLHKRLNFRAKVMLGPDITDFLGVSHNLSPDGICVMALDAQTPGSIINIDIFYDSSGAYSTTTREVVSVQGKVMWVSKLSEFISLMGIKFNKRYDKLIQIYNSKLSGSY